MDIEYRYLTKVTLEEFADQHGFSMLVTECLDHGNKVYKAHFKEKVVLKTIEETQQAICGYGDSPTAAIQDYATQISDKDLIHIWYRGSLNLHETHIRVPLLTYNPNTDCRPNNATLDPFVDWLEDCRPTGRRLIRSSTGLESESNLKDNTRVKPHAIPE